MFVNKDEHTKYAELLVTYKDYVETFNSLYQLKSENEEEINKLFNMIKTNLIDTKYFGVDQIIKIFSNIIIYRNGYLKSYFALFKKFYEEYHPKQVPGISVIFNYFAYKKYGIVLDNMRKSSINQLEKQNLSLDVHEENTIYRSIMNDDKERFIAFTETPEFDEKQLFKSELYPYNKEGYNLIELCCYHGAVNCFKFLRTKYKSPITETCLQFSFLSGKPDIMSECMKARRPYDSCMRYAIISHNIDFICFLMNEYNIRISLENCCEFKNLQAFLVFLDQTEYIQTAFTYSASFNIPELCKYLIQCDSNILLTMNNAYPNTNTAINYAVEGNSVETAKFLFDNGAKFNRFHSEKYELHIAIINNCKKWSNYFFLKAPK
ncbi:hypothetical protein TVAG_166950 [Trichomonas vaginalis G3]|uniref:DUF3447 domain-containing protein n=1 Tax=Trichomonas vaginalis (strain ATCC PRA-98 / G3) TaxID=412133 RepID=A2DEA2_TRIV3|nr:protein of unknown function (DUF3447) [Trichomonas vaginalis G3]EAY21320.1 hypothetical protein TVAG_166950 [Trichomonas vaginalis G3]KAI5548943.1 protein of unknown function (DUF3447) [Trichomonas vaginalis G3]|eukprot:XP_001582306.1 hypothetical protein [Trichomonas vaginalis G3]